jgi:5-methylcytosine-specific restriction endonuclease McrA
MAWTKTAADRQRDSQRYGSQWRKARLRQLEADGYRCQLRLDGCLGQASQVDHVDQAANDPQHQRLRSVCSPCHRKITAQQGGGARRRHEVDTPPKQCTLF